MNPNITIAPGLTISRVVTGLWQIADLERDGQVLDPVGTSRFMEPYVKEGFTSFDMADHYGSSEIIAGTFKNQNALGDSTQLFTKWVPEPGKVDRQTVREAVERALDRMQLQTIDLMQFHAWYYPDPSWLDSLGYLKELQDEGLIHHLGVTNFDAAHLRVACASGIPLVTNQVCHSLIDRRAQKEMVEVCQKYSVKLLAFGTLAGGFLTDRWLDKPEPKSEELQTWSEMKYKRFVDVAGGWDKLQNLLTQVKCVAKKHGVSMANVSTRYILENPAVASVIIGARLGRSEHIADNKRILSISMDQEDMSSIQSAIEELTEVPGDCGDEYRKPPFLTASGDLSHHLKSIPKAFEPKPKSANRQEIFSGTVWEEMAGFSRAVKVGNRILVSGTTATHGDMLVGGDDPAAQTHFILDKIEGAIESFGGKMEDVVRTRILVNDMKDWEPVARAHGQRFKGIDPANTLVQAGIVGDGYLVEIEAEAEISA